MYVCDVIMRHDPFMDCFITEKYTCTFVIYVNYKRNTTQTFSTRHELGAVEKLGLVKLDQVQFEFILITLSDRNRYFTSHRSTRFLIHVSQLQTLMM